MYLEDWICGCTREYGGHTAINPHSAPGHSRAYRALKNQLRHELNDFIPFNFALLAVHGLALREQNAAQHNSVSKDRVLGGNADGAHPNAGRIKLLRLQKRADFALVTGYLLGFLGNLLRTAPDPHEQTHRAETGGLHGYAYHFEALNRHVQLRFELCGVKAEAELVQKAAHGTATPAKQKRMNSGSQGPARGDSATELVPLDIK